MFMLRNEQHACAEGSIGKWDDNKVVFAACVALFQVWIKACSKNRGGLLVSLTVILSCLFQKPILGCFINSSLCSVCHCPSLGPKQILGLHKNIIFRNLGAMIRNWSGERESHPLRSVYSGLNQIWLYILYALSICC